MTAAAKNKFDIWLEPKFDQIDDDIADNWGSQLTDEEQNDNIQDFKPLVHNIIWLEEGLKL